MKNITETLKKLIAENGVEILQQEQRLKAMLADLHPAEKRFRYLLELSFRAEIPRKLIALQNESKSIWETRGNTMQHYFKEEYFLEDAAVKSIFDCWVEVLKKEENTVIDIDSNIYHIVKIGNQEWLVENLKTTRYRNGDLIENATNYNKWEELKNGAWCYYANNPEYNSKYGKLYNSYAVNDPREIAPKGWRVPTKRDWLDFEDILYEGESDWDERSWGIRMAKMLAAKTEWLTSNVEGAIGNDLIKNNKSGFTALPGGILHYGEFSDLGSEGFWWSSSELDPDFGYVYYLTMSSDSKNIMLAPYGNKHSGLSIRCIKDC